MIMNKFLYKLYVLYYDRIVISEEIDINKTSTSKVCLSFNQMSAVVVKIY